MSQIQQTLTASAPNDAQRGRQNRRVNFRITPSKADVSPQTQPRAGLTFKEKLGYNPPYHK